MLIAYLVTPDFPQVMTQCEILRSRCQSKIHESRKNLFSSEELRYGLPICNTSNDILPKNIISRNKFLILKFHFCRMRQNIWRVAIKRGNQQSE